MSSSTNTGFEVSEGTHSTVDKMALRTSPQDQFQELIPVCMTCQTEHVNHGLDPLEVCD